MPQLIGIKSRLQKHYESKNNLRTFQADNREILRKSQLQTNFTGSYKKECAVFILSVYTGYSCTQQNKKSRLRIFLKIVLGEGY